MQTSTTEHGALSAVTTPVEPIQARGVASAMFTAGELAAAVKAVLPAISAQAINPALACCRLKVADGGGEMTGSDGDFMIRVPVQAESGGEFDCLLPARILRDSLKSIPAAALVHLTAELIPATVPSGTDSMKLKIEGGGRSFTMSGLTPDYYPESGAPGNLVYRLPVGALRTALALTSFAAVKESGTGGIHYTNGVYMSCRETACDVVATDGHRLGLYRLEGIAATGFDFDSLQSSKRGEERPNKGLLIPARVAVDLLKALPDAGDESAEVEIYIKGITATFILRPCSFTKGRKVVQFPGFTMTTSLLDLKFPDYERVIPKDIEARVQADRAAFCDALRAVMPITRSRDRNPVAVLRWSADRLTLTSDGGENGTGETSIPAEATAPGCVALNPQYLIDALKALGGEQVTINWVDEVTPLMLTSTTYPAFTYIVVPIRMA